MDIIRLTEDNLYEAAGEAARVLKRGGIVLFPTDTLYGLAVDARNRVAIDRLKRVKARETRKPISVIVPHHAALEEHVHLNERGRMLAEAHLPGALTLVVPAKGTISEDLTLNGALGVRIPNDRFALALAEAFGGPYTATSANMSGVPTASEVHQILDQLRHAIAHIDLAIDAGPRDGGTPSTVVAIVGDDAYVLREGAIRKEDLGL